MNTNTLSRVPQVGWPKTFLIRDGNLYFVVTSDGKKYTRAKVHIPIPSLSVKSRPLICGMLTGGPLRVEATVEVRKGDVFDLKVGIHQAVLAAKRRMVSAWESQVQKARKNFRGAVFAGKIMNKNPFAKDAILPLALCPPEENDFHAEEMA
jgi:hypothetical protein